MHASVRLSLSAALLLSTSVFAAEPTLSTNEDRWSSFLPIGAEKAREHGYGLPLPFGVGVNFMNIWQDYDIKSIDLTLQGPVPIPIEGVQVSTASGTAMSVDGRIDAWVFPFLNVYGVAGYTRGDSTAQALVPASSLGMFGITNDLRFPFTLDYEGVTYGGGLTLVGGYKEFFASMDYNYTVTQLNVADSLITANVFTTRLGWNGQIGRFQGAAWLGSMYQGIAQKFRGDLDVALPPLPGTLPVQYAVDQEATDPWNMLAGVQWHISKHFDLAVEGGFIGRRQILASMTCRF
jgi:hypothetical protein